MLFNFRETAAADVYHWGLIPNSNCEERWPVRFRETWPLSRLNRALVLYFIGVMSLIPEDLLMKWGTLEIRLRRGRVALSHISSLIYTDTQMAFSGLGS